MEPALISTSVDVNCYMPEDKIDILQRPIGQVQQDRERLRKSFCYKFWKQKYKGSQW